MQITESTKTALEKLVQTKISAAMPVRAAEKQAPSHFVMSDTDYFFLLLMLPYYAENTLPALQSFY